ncbi:MAG: DUF1631 family protein [Thiobacillus sp.]
MNQSLGPDGREKRRYPRKPTQLAAQLRFADGTTLAGEVRDYCQAGLFAALAGRHVPELAVAAQIGSTVSVVFAAEPSAGRPLQLNGWIARVAPDGVGVFVPSLPEVALEALRRASARVAAPAGGLPNGAPSLQQAQALQQECTSQFRSFLDAVMQEFFLQGMERLARAGAEEDSFLERSRYEYGAQELMQRRAQIEEAFFNAIRERIHSVGPDAGTDTQKRGSQGLSLVDEAEFEDWLNLSAVIKEIESDLAPQLDEFEQRYSRLVGRTIERKNNPFGPEIIGRTFQGAIQGLDFTNRMRTVLYKALGRAVSSHGPALYRQLNQTLAPLQPMTPAVAPARSAARSEPPATPPSESRAKPDLAQIADTLNRLYAEGQGGVAAAPDDGGYSLERILATLDQSLRARPAAAPQPARAVPAEAPSELLRVVDRLQQTQRALTTGTAAVAAAPGAAGTAAPAASLQEVMAALDALPLSGMGGGAVPAPSLVEQVDARVSAAGAGHPLAPLHRQILDTTSQLFSRARADVVPDSEVESLIKRLERPLLKLALRDTRFPATTDHPARQVLNLIEQFAVAADDKGKFFDPKLQRFLYLLVDRVCSRAEEDPGVYDMVRDSLAKVLRPILQTRRSRVARVQEASEGRERIRQARNRVNQALEARLGGHEVPGVLLRLLDAGWRQHLVLLEMREGAGSARWQAALAVVDRLSDRLAASPSPVDVPALLSEIERGLSAVNVDVDLLAAFLDEIGAKLERGVTASPPVYVPPGRLAAPQHDTAEIHARLIAQLRLGDWWEIPLDGMTVPMQLVWLSEPPFSCTFANRSATRKLDFTLDELAQRIREGRARLGKDRDVPLLDRSEHALFDDSYAELMQLAQHDPLTGLPNRKGFMQRLAQQRPAEEAGKTHVVGVLEFDQFRLIRNSCGEQAIETLARTLANRIRVLVGANAVVAAFGEDTLALLLPDCKREGGCASVKALLDQLKDVPFKHGEHSYRIGFNLGLSEFDPARFSAAEAVRRADSACLTAKSLGRNQVQVYEEDTPQLQTLESFMDWAGRLDGYLQGEGLFLRCQKVMPLAASPTRLPYYEILLGVSDGNGGVIGPADFFPIVEHLKRAHDLDLWVIREVFSWIRGNRATFDTLGGLAINLSANSLRNRELQAALRALLTDADFPLAKIMFEITETAAIESYGAVQDFIRDLRRYGCKFALDDFGSGFTSYAHLKNLRTDTLKIDGSFVKDMLRSEADYAMVKSMNDIAHSLGLATVAEFVESAQLIEALKTLGVDYVQGYAIHKPCRIDELALSFAQ